eukprot:scaffold17565_cov124-Isochrysis_galbana.AAC.3
MARAWARYVWTDARCTVPPRWCERLGAYPGRVRRLALCLCGHVGASRWAGSCKVTGTSVWVGGVKTRRRKK